MDTKTVGIKQTIEVINRMKADGVIGRYALHPIPLLPRAPRKGPAGLTPRNRKRTGW